MIPLGETRNGQIALRKRIHDLFKTNPGRGFQVADIAATLGADAKKVSASIINMVTDPKIAINYPHIVRMDRGLYTYDPARPQQFVHRAKRIKTTKRSATQPAAQPVAQPMADFFEEKNVLVLRHKSGKLYIARPVS